MADRSPNPESNPDTGNGADAASPGRGSPPGMPLWVKVFGIIGIVAVVVVVIALITGRGGPGGGHGPGRHMLSGDSGGGTSTPGRGGVGGPASADASARRIEVTAADTLTFEPNGITVSAGETVTFVVTNNGQILHEFTLGDASMQKEHADMMAHMPAGMAHDLPNSIRLQPGETKHLTWRFGGAGTIEYACHEPGHYQARMRGQITVR